jgi:uncharacterized protein YecA (UPF0149 family)
MQERLNFNMNKDAIIEKVDSGLYTPNYHGVTMVDGEIKKVQQKLVQKRTKIGRNKPCPCGSGRKYKKCCLNKA